ncbi:High affinity nerve growth factor receptor [Gossypium arboreum]|uniref:High affinity nerve growth factor receptor n=1 Tax=Gossypium arboreum TaxID=29729 RepID=A0A0B0NE81_GOSAR|nr:High affinity nerve growth factor receptor [Gossypium arboreum]
MLVSLKGIKSFAPYLGRDSKPIYFDIERDHFIPRINLQDYGYNQGESLKSIAWKTIEGLSQCLINR